MPHPLFVMMIMAMAIAKADTNQVITSEVKLSNKVQVAAAKYLLNLYEHLDITASEYISSELLAWPACSKQAYKNAFTALLAPLHREMHVPAALIITLPQTRGYARKQLRKRGLLNAEFDYGRGYLEGVSSLSHYRHSCISRGDEYWRMWFSVKERMPTDPILAIKYEEIIQNMTRCSRRV